MKWCSFMREKTFSPAVLVLLVQLIVIQADGHSFHGRFDSRGRAARHFYKKYTNKSVQIGRESNENLREFQTMLASGMDPESVMKVFTERERSNVLNNVGVDVCRRTNPDCDPYTPYRSPDGQCNNLFQPYWGAAFTFLRRILPDAYEDGRNEPRGGGAKVRSSLPNPRLISTTIHHDLIAPDPFLTNMVPQFGQFLDHDITLSPEDDLECCGKDRDDADCFPIEIPSADLFYNKVNQTCLPLTRSTPFCFPGTSGVREQMNSLTAFVDASQVYGSDKVRQDQLRHFKRGLLTTSKSNPKLLPTVAEIEDSTGSKVEIMGAFAAGDERVNEMPALTAMHTLLVREHNRLAQDIYRVRSYWNDEQIFQAARRLLIAEWQKVVYGEYLPVILGAQAMGKYDLHVTFNTHSTYEPHTDPTIFQAFSTAAYRFGHTLLNGVVRLYKDLYQTGSYKIRNGFFEESIIKQNDGEGYDLLLGGLMQQNAQQYDPYVTEDLTNFLLREKEDNFGSDLIARNIQRGREHGIAPYHSYRRACNLASLSTWSSRPREIPADIWKKLKTVYASPYDIDLFTGGLSEVPVTGGVTGATFNCLKAMQFQKIKAGDRFFYTHNGQAGSFTLDQITKINQRTLGDIICDNSVISRTPSNVFLITSSSNPWIQCNDPYRRHPLNVTDFL